MDWVENLLCEEAVARINLLEVVVVFSVDLVVTRGDLEFGFCSSPRVTGF